MFEFIEPAFGRIIAISAAVCGFATWIVLALGLAYCQFFVPKIRTKANAVLSPRTASQLFVIVAAAWISAAGLLLAVVALVVGYSANWAWVGIGTTGTF
jgi:hypothetical protein